MNDMTPVIIPKSDQVSADDFISGPRSYTIERVEIRPGTEQPVSIFLAGEERAWKPCKSMSRVLVAAWGPDAKTYAGRSVTLYRDGKVKWGGMEVGGIRISHLSHLDHDLVLALTATKGKKAAYTVKPLRQEPRRHERLSDDGRTSARDDSASRQDAPQGDGGQTQGPTLSQRADAYEGRLKSAPGSTKLKALRAAAEQLRGDLLAADPERLTELDNLFNDLFAEAEDRERDA